MLKSFLEVSSNLAVPLVKLQLPTSFTVSNLPRSPKETLNYNFHQIKSNPNQPLFPPSIRKPQAVLSSQTSLNLNTYLKLPTKFQHPSLPSPPSANLIPRHPFPSSSLKKPPTLIPRPQQQASTPQSPRNTSPNRRRSMLR